MKKRGIILLLLLTLAVTSLLLAGAQRAEALTAVTTQLYVPRKESAGLMGKVYLVPDGDSFVLYLPGSADPEQLVLCWSGDTTVKDKSGKVLTSGTVPVPAPGERAQYIVNGYFRKIRTEQGSPDVKAMFLVTHQSVDGFVSFEEMNGDKKKEKEAAGVMAYGETGGYYFSIKGRGNSTWTAGYPKKPYNITIYKDDTYSGKKSVELIDGVKAKKWSLLANYSDISMMRNKLGYDMALQMGIGLDSAYVDLYADGAYLGTYLMTPKSDYESPENGYMLEIDNYIDSEDHQFLLEGMGEYDPELYGYQNRISVKDNESKTPNEEIEAYMQKAWNAMLDTASEDYLNYIDLDSWAKFYLLHEFYKSFDVVCGSILMHRDGATEADKLIAGPMWDLDNTMGRTNNNADLGLTKEQQHDPHGWYIPSVSDPEGRVRNFWLQQLGKHESFMQRVYEMYHLYRPVFDGAAAKVDVFAEELALSAAMNFDLYGMKVSAHKVAEADGHGCVRTRNWEEYIQNLRNYAEKRAEFLGKNVPKMEGIEPIVPTVPVQPTEPSGTEAVPPTTDRENDVTLPCGMDDPPAPTAKPGVVFWVLIPSAVLVLLAAAFLLLKRKK